MRALLILLLLLADLVGLRFLAPLLGLPLLLAWVILTFFIGLTIVRLAGASALHNIGLQLRSGQLPGRRTIDDGLHVLAGALLAFPGFLTDFLAVVLLIAPLRHLASALLFSHLSKRLGVPEPDEPVFHYTIGPDGRPIRDVDVEVHDEPSEDNHEHS